MSSGDFTFITLRNITAYQTNNAYIPNDYLLSMSTNGNAQWTNHIKLNTLTASTITTSTINIDILSFSSITGSTINIDTLSFSSIIGSTINANTMILHSSLTVSSISTGLLSIDELTFSSLTGNSITANTMELHSSLSVSSISTGLLFADVATFSSLTGNTITANTMELHSSLTVSSISTGLLFADVATFSSLIGSTINANTMELHSSLTVSSINTVHFFADVATFSTLSGSTINANTMTLNLLTTVTPSLALGLDASNQVITFPASSGTVTTSSLTSRFIPYLSTGTTLTNSLLNQINDTDIGLGFTSTPIFPFNYPLYSLDKNLYVNGAVFSGEMNAGAATIGLSSTSISFNKSIGFGNGGPGLFVSQIVSHTGISPYGDATWEYSNTVAAPLTANTGQVDLTADKFTLNLANGLHVSTITVSSIIMNPTAESIRTNYTNTNPDPTMIASILINIGGTMWKIPIERVP